MLHGVAVTALVVGSGPPLPPGMLFREGDRGAHRGVVGASRQAGATPPPSSRPCLYRPRCGRPGTGSRARGPFVPAELLAKALPRRPRVVPEKGWDAGDES